MDEFWTRVQMNLQTGADPIGVRSGHQATPARRQTSRVRGLPKVKADFNLLAAAVNLARLATLGATNATGWGASTA
jgi:hypothetical protein